MEIKVKYLTDIDHITKIANGDWIDLRAAEDVDIPAGESKYIPLGVCIQLPKGYEAIIAPRSSSYKKYGIWMTNSIGIIDESYCGDNDQWCFSAYSPNGSHIHKNDRICQFRLFKHQDDFDITEVDHLGNDNRGGFGSTGI